MSGYVGPSESAESADSAESAESAESASVLGGGGMRPNRPIGRSPAVLPVGVGTVGAWCGPNMFWQTNSWPPSGSSWSPILGVASTTPISSNSSYQFLMSPSAFLYGRWEPAQFAQAVIADVVANGAWTPTSGPAVPPWNLLLSTTNDAVPAVSQLVIAAEVTALSSSSGSPTVSITAPTTFSGSNGSLQWELQELQALAAYRGGVYAEAMAQNNAILQYYRGILGFNQRSFPATTFLLLAASRVASFLCMYYKNLFNRERPSSRSPNLFPPIDPPGHPSYPSGHATQAMLMALFLEQVLPPGITPPTASSWDNPGWMPADDEPLRTMARRIGRNREVLGLHYPSDSYIGRKLAQNAFMAMLSPGVTTIMGNSAVSNRGSQAFTTFGSEFTVPNLSRTAYADGLLYMAYQEWN